MEFPFHLLANVIRDQTLLAHLQWRIVLPADPSKHMLTLPAEKEALAMLLTGTPITCRSPVQA